jgi:type II secretory pathway pseudopilin PulG
MKNVLPKKTKLNVFHSESGFTLAGVLVALAFLLILMAAAATQWSFIKKRAKEEELLFRGTQYARALKFYYKKYNTFPNELKELLDEKCIRQLYKDPMTEDGEWVLIRGANTATALTEVQNRLQNPAAPSEEGETQQESAFKLGENMGPIIGVCSKSTEKSIKEYNGQRYYNLWAFIADMSVVSQQVKTEGQQQKQPEEQEQQPTPEKEPETPPENEETPPESI